MAHPPIAPSVPKHAQSFRRVALAGLAYQAVITFYQLVIPAAIARQYDSSVLGLWFTLYSLLGLGMAVNLGMPGALLSRIDGREQGDRAANATHIASALSLTLWLAAAWLAAALATLFLPLEHWFQLDDSVGSTRALLRVFLSATAFMLVANLAQPLYVALFRSHQAYALAMVVHLLALPCVMLVAWLKPDFWVLAMLFLSPPIISGLALWSLGLRRGYLALANPSAASRRALWSVGAPFLAMEAVTALILRTPEAVLSQLHGLVEAGRFSVFQRFPLLLSAVLTVVLQPSWPSLAAAARESNAREGAAIIRRSLLSMLLLWALFAICVLPLGELLVTRWLGNTMTYTPQTMYLAVCFGLAQSLHYCTALALVGLEDRRANLRINVVMLLTYIPLNYLLTKQFAATGTYVSLLIVFGAIGTPLGVFAYRARLREMRASSASPA
jgi:O-antigen/teichoic acid export membrane protein